MFLLGSYSATLYLKHLSHHNHCYVKLHFLFPLIGTLLSTKISINSDRNNIYNTSKTELWRNKDAPTPK